MQTRTRHVVCIETAETLTTAKNGATWRAFAETLGYDASYAATLNQAARGIPGAMTHKAENILRVRLGLLPIQLLEIPACPDCGEAHTGRCHGKPVVRVVVLAPGEVVTQERRSTRTRNRKNYFRPCLPPDLEPVVAAQMQATGLTGAAFWRKLLEDA